MRLDQCYLLIVIVNFQAQQTPKITTVTNIERKGYFQPRSLLKLNLTFVLYLEAPVQTQPVPPIAVVPAPVEPPVQTILAPISPRQDALSEMAEKKRQKWMREKGNVNTVKSPAHSNHYVKI